MQTKLVLRGNFISIVHWHLYRASPSFQLFALDAPDNLLHTNEEINTTIR